MYRARYLIFIVVLVMVGGVCWFIGRSGSNEQRGRTQASEEDGVKDEKAKKKLDRMIERVRLSRAVAQESEKEEDFGNGETLIVVDEKDEDPQNNEREFAEQAKMVKNIEQRIIEEDNGADWASAAEDQIDSKFLAYDIEGLSVVEKSCRETVCKSIVSFNKPGDIVSFVSKALDDPPFEISSVFIPEPREGRDSLQSLVYYSKKDSEPLL